MNMKKKVISIIFLAGLSAMTVSVQAQIPQEQLEEVLGQWYCPRMGYVIDIEPGTDEYVVMSVQDLESDREHTHKNDTPEYENMYYLYYSDETDEENEWNLWKCINSGPEVEIRDNEMNIVIPDNVMVFGEIGLSGEIRAVSMAGQRVQEAKKLGFETVMLPEVCKSSVGKIDGINLVYVSQIRDAISYIMRK